LDKSPSATSPIAPPGASIHSAQQGSSKNRAQEDNERPGSRSSSQMENPGGNNPTTPNNPSMSSSTSGTMYQGKVRTTSAPTSPLKEKKASFFGKVANSNFSAVVSQRMEQAKTAAGNIHVPGRINRDKCFTLLVIDDANTDWSKYFRGKKIHGEYDIRVEQAEFKELSVNSSSINGVVASIILAKSGNKVVRSFKPDFLLVRQNSRDAHEDHRSILYGFQYGNIPSVNTLESLYNFQDRPWTFSQLIKIQEKLGKDKFPLIEQTYFPGHQEMNGFSNFPCVFKVGHAHGGMGKVRVDNEKGFQDITSLVGLSQNYCTVEPFIDAKYDLHIQKIGDNYKALKRKSLSGNWKTNIGQSLLEEVPVSGHHKLWIDEVSSLFGGLGICSLEAVVAKDDKEYIIEINDSATSLLGESQEDDRKNIAELVLTTMQEKLKVIEDGKLNETNETVTTPSSTPSPAASAPATNKMSAVSNKMMSNARQLSKNSLGGLGDPKSRMASTVMSAMGKKTAQNSDATNTTTNTNKPPPTQNPGKSPTGPSGPIKPSPGGPPPTGKPSPGPSGITKNGTTAKKEEAVAVVEPKPSTSRKRHDSQASEETSSVSATSSATSAVKKVPELPKDSDEIKNDDNEEGPEGEDTMKNLKKTFAGIFGDNIN